LKGDLDADGDIDGLYLAAFVTNFASTNYPTLDKQKAGDTEKKACQPDVGWAPPTEKSTCGGLKSGGQCPPYI
jgi:hypothetical protein